MKTAMEEYGITKDTLVILYSTTANMAAVRIAWILMYCGVENVRLLDGGFNAWKTQDSLCQPKARQKKR